MCARVGGMGGWFGLGWVGLGWAGLGVGGGVDGVVCVCVSVRAEFQNSPPVPTKLFHDRWSDQPAVPFWSTTNCPFKLTAWIPGLQHSLDKAF